MFIITSIIVFIYCIQLVVFTSMLVSDKIFETEKKSINSKLKFWLFLIPLGIIVLLINYLIEYYKKL